MEDASSVSLSVDTAEHRYPVRVRTMTGSSMGSFSSYLQEKETPRMMVVTSQHPEEKPTPVTPCAASTEAPQGRVEQLEQELQEARWERTEALEALQQLAQGIRLVTRQIKQSHNQAATENASTATADQDDDGYESSSSSHHKEDSYIHNTNAAISCTSSIQSYVSDYDRQLVNISHQLDDGSGFGADLMGLSHAAQMVHENVRMVSREANDLVQDVQSAQQSQQEATARAQKAERLVKRLYKENQALEKQVETLKTEKRVLKREVKTLHQERTASQQEESQALRSGMLRVMEEYVAGALKVHERQLAKASCKNSLGKKKKELPTSRSGDITKDLNENYVGARDNSVPSGETKAKEPKSSNDDEPGSSKPTDKTKSSIAIDDVPSDNEGSCDTAPINNTDGTLHVEEKKEDDYEGVSKPPSSGFKARSMGGFKSGGALGFGGFGSKKKSNKTASSPAPKLLLVSSKDESEKTKRSIRPVSPKNVTTVGDTKTSGKKKAPSALATPTSWYKPVTFSTPVRSADTPTETDIMASSKKEEDLGSRVKNFFNMSQQSYQSFPADRRASLLLLDDKSVDTAENNNGNDKEGAVQDEAPAETDIMASSKREEDLGSRVKNFFNMSQQSYQSFPADRRTSLLLLDDKSVDTAQNDKEGAVQDEARSPFDSPLEKQREPMVVTEQRNDPSPNSTTRPADINIPSPHDFVVTFDSTAMNDYVLSPFGSNSAAGFGGDASTPTDSAARSVTISFESHLLRSLAVPSSETPLSIQPRPSRQVIDDALYEC